MISIHSFCPAYIDTYENCTITEMAKSNRQTRAMRR